MTRDDLEKIPGFHFPSRPSASGIKWNQSDTCIERPESNTYSVASLNFTLSKDRGSSGEQSNERYELNEKLASGSR